MSASTGRGRLNQLLGGGGRSTTRPRRRRRPCRPPGGLVPAPVRGDMVLLSGGQLPFRPAPVTASQPPELSRRVVHGTARDRTARFGTSRQDTGRHGTGSRDAVNHDTERPEYTSRTVTERNAISRKHRYFYSQRDSGGRGQRDWL